MTDDRGKGMCKYAQRKRDGSQETGRGTSCKERFAKGRTAGGAEGGDAHGGSGGAAQKVPAAEAAGIASGHGAGARAGHGQTGQATGSQAGGGQGQLRGGCRRCYARGLGLGGGYWSGGEEEGGHGQ